VTGTIFDIKKYSVHDGPGIRTTVFFKGCPLECAWCHNPEGQRMSAEIMFYSDRCSACGICVSICLNQAVIPKDVDHEITGVHPNWPVVLKEGSDGKDSGSPDMNRAYEIHTLREKCTACGECVKACPSGAREVAGRVVTSDELIQEIMKDVVFYDSSGGGVTFSGGEPLMQPDFLLVLLRECKEREIHTAVDTCGCAKWETLSAIVPYADLILYDLKCMDAGMHFELTGRRNEVIIENLTRLSKTHNNVTVRFPLIPGVNDNEENIVSMGEFLSSLSREGKSPCIDVLPYHKTGMGKYERLGRVYNILHIARPADEVVDSVVEKLRRLGLETRVGG
jgi:pyruvate formate lyase activating enzyme